jgi:hypothetical protein
MKRQEYSPKEALERVKLMMNYDSRKTLTENKETISEGPGTAAAVSGGVGAGVGAGAAALGVLPGTATVAGLGTVGVTGIGGAAEVIGATLGIGLAGGAAVIGGAVALAVVPLAYWLITKDTGSEKVKKMIQYCSSDATKIAKLERKISDGEIRNMADAISDAINYETLGFMAGTDEDALYETFGQLTNGTASDFCALVNYYNRNNAEVDLFDDLDSDIDAESEWTKIYRPIRNCVEDSLLKLKDENPCKEGEIMDPKTKKCVVAGGGNTPVVPPSGSNKSKWRVCADPYSRGCKETDPNGPLHKVQECIGVKSDGLFGGKTEAALLSKTQSKSFMSKDVDKICSSSGGGGQQVQDDEYTIDTENQEAGETDTEGV